MENLPRFIQQNAMLFIMLGGIDIALGLVLSRIMRMSGSGRVAEALGARSPGISLYKRCSKYAAQGMSACGKHLENGSLYKKAVLKMRKSGYRGEYAPIAYIFSKFVAIPLIFIAALILNYPDIIRPLASAVLIYTVIETVISGKKRKMNLRFQKYIYKIYKYLHNQISSGVKPTDAVRTVYEIVEDAELRDIMIRLAARYELTLDIDKALEEFRTNFDAHEVETLCIALKQGIDTGDNQDLLARQEDIMFKKYFNYIQTETDSCRNRCVAAASVFVAIVVVMIAVPMLNDVGEAAGKIFIS